jgi:hypothetical protein
MLLRPNTIPGKPFGTVPLPFDKICPFCKMKYRKVNLRKHKSDKVTKHCPHCEHELKIELPKKEK